MRIEAEPDDGLIDGTLAVRALGAQPGSEVALTVTCIDASGNRWESRNVYVADADGVVDTATSAPRKGTYEGVDPTGPVWSMTFASEDVAPVMFAAPADLIDLEITAEAGGESAATTVVRRWTAPGVMQRELRGEGFVGLLYEPALSGPRHAVALVPGTTGPEAMAPTAALLASHGMSAMVVAYTGREGLPPTLCEVPLEALEAAVRALAAQPKVTSVSLLCASVGSEGALSMLAGEPDLDVRRVVALAPSSVVWQALAEGRPSDKSSWTRNGEPLPYVRIHGQAIVPESIKNHLLSPFSRHPRPNALHLRNAYSPGSGDVKALDAAAIPVEKISAPILFVTGDDDQMWPASIMAVTMIERREQAGLTGDRHLRFENAGHIIHPPVTPTTVTWTDSLYSGGTPEGCAKAEAEAWPEILAFLSAP